MADKGLARAAALGLATFVLAAAAFAEQDAPTSGVPVGGKTAAFQVQDVTGPAKGKQLCYI